jgi:hypothetical protein
MAPPTLLASVQSVAAIEGCLDREEEVSGTQSSAHYEIRVAGVLEPHWSAWFDGLEVTSDDQRGETVMAGPVADQAALHGLLAKVRDLGLTLIAVHRIEAD